MASFLALPSAEGNTCALRIKKHTAKDIENGHARNKRRLSSDDQELDVIKKKSKKKKHSADVDGNTDDQELDVIKKKSKKKKHSASGNDVSNDEKHDGVKQKSENEAVASKSLSSSAGRRFTVSLAIPGSLMSSASRQTQELSTLLAGQVARAAAIFAVDEIIVFDEACSLPTMPGNGQDVVDEASALAPLERNGTQWNDAALLALLLRYSECPQYLRKHLFGVLPALRCAGLLSPLAAQHHLLRDERTFFREGVVLESGLVDVGLFSVRTDKRLRPGLRVTLRDPGGYGGADGAVWSAVSPCTPRVECGLSWGYKVKLVNGLSGVLAAARDYDCVIGTSERGSNIDELSPPLPSFKKMLIVFGGVHGLEASMQADYTFNEHYNAPDPAPLFQHYFNTCPNQASRTIRTEEAIFITLSGLRRAIGANGLS